MVARQPQKAVHESLLPADLPADEAATRLVESLRRAQRCEETAAVRYEAYAKVADHEGHPAAGHLFRGMAASEAIQAANHTVVLKRLGGAPAATAEPLRVGTTVENLVAAVQVESAERDSLYPAWLELARRGRRSDVARTLSFSLESAEQQVLLCRAMAANLASPGQAAAKYLLCPTCGYLMEHPELSNCPCCLGHRDELVLLEPSGGRPASAPAKPGRQRSLFPHP